MPSRKTLSLLALIIIILTPSHAQDEAEEVSYTYTKWATSSFPRAYENVSFMVIDLWGAEDAKKVDNLVELHLKSLKNMMDLYEEADLRAFSKALDKWSRTTEDERLESWWYWPNTNWIKVEEEYGKLIEGG